MEDFGTDDFDITEEHLEQLENIEISLLNSSFIINSDSDYSEEIQPPKRKRRRILESESEVSDSEHIQTIRIPSSSGNSNSTGIWTESRGNQRRIIAFTDIPGPPPHIRHMTNMTFAECFALFVSEDVLELIVNATNNFALLYITKTPEATRYARIRKWSPTNIIEIRKFLGLIVFMGLVKLPKLADYWSRDVMIGHPFPRTVMSRNRFELLLQMLHFSENDIDHKSDRLHRVRKLYDVMNNKFQENYLPAQEICIDESMVPFRGRIIFRQYNKQKRHKYGIKEFKLCTIPGYTYKVSVYAGKNDILNTTPTNVVLSLCEDLLNRGHTLFTDNWYTSLPLARQLLGKETHLVGTVRKNRRGLPLEITKAKLKRGDYRAAESIDGITILRWKDKRDVFLMSTKHNDRFVEVQKRGKIIRKPKVVLDYNRVKGAVDLSDQLSSYSTPLRKSVKWYKKLGINLLLNTALVNALILYQAVTKKNANVTDFRKAIVREFCKDIVLENQDSQKPKRMKHKISRKDGKASKFRRLCSGCYKNNVDSKGRIYARNKTKKVNTYCQDCPGQPFMCFTCFNTLHR